jgi:hypothetical protein
VELAQPFEQSNLGGRRRARPVLMLCGGRAAR